MNQWHQTLERRFVSLSPRQEQARHVVVGHRNRTIVGPPLTDLMLSSGCDWR